MGLYFKQEVPFHDVYIHATVMTEDGKRMSKSLGTGVDPGEVMRQDRRRRDPVHAAVSGWE